MTELPEGTKVVACGPALDDLSVIAEAKHLHCRGSNSLARRRLSHVSQRISCRDCVAVDDHVALRNHRFDLDPEIRKHAAQHRNHPLHILRTVGRKWVTRI